MTERLHLSPRHRAMIEGLLKEHLPGIEVWAYGSRVNGRSHDGSDLDLVLRAPGLTEIPSSQLADFQEAVRESNIPFLVEARDWACLPVRFHREIERDYVVVKETQGGHGGTGESFTATVADLQRAGILLVEDGNHGEYRPRRDEFVKEGVAFIRAADMDAGRVLVDGASKINTRARRRIRKGIGAPGDILLSHKGTVGKVALIPDDTPPFVCSPQTTFWRCLNESIVDRRYLYSFLRSPRFSSQLAALAGETDMAPYVSLTSQRTLEVVLPPIVEQRAIAHILGALDDKIELNRRMSETLEAMAHTLFKSWLVDFDPVRAKMAGRDPGLPQHIADLFPDRLVNSRLGEVPEGWEVRSLDDLIDVNPARRLRKGQIAPYLDMVNMPTKGHVPNEVVDRPFGSGMRFINGDTLVARITPCLENGKTAYVDFLQDGEIGWGSTEFIVMRPKSPLPHEFGYCLARSLHFREFAIQNMTGTSGRQRVPAQALQQFPIVCPTEEVAVALGDVIRPLIAQAGAVDRESRSIGGLRDTLLPKLISGKLCVYNLPYPTEGAK